MFSTTSPSSEAEGVSITTNVDVVVEDGNVNLVLGVDESYTLEVPLGTSAATIRAKTIYGAMMGLQTLSQAVRYDFDAGIYGVAGCPLSVTDAPRFAWRGILVDTDRHWLSVRTLKAVVDSMGFSKLNVLHWHLADWQAWPLQSVALPDLWNASWSKRERYTLADVAAVVSYASKRGVRVMPEFDTPGHCASMCLGYPELCADSEGCGSGANSPLTPVPDAEGSPVALNAIEAVITEIAGVATDEFFHLGGDIIGVNQACWSETPSVQAWMASQGYTSTDQIYQYFVDNTNTMAINLDKSPVRWEEVWSYFGTSLDKRTVVHAWLSKDAVVNATANGYRAIWSVNADYYLDYLDVTWETFYDVDVLEGVEGANAQSLVLGGETAMWGETADGSDVLQTIYPRAAASAERLWSYAGGMASGSPGVLERLLRHRCYLLERGVPVAPVGAPLARAAPTDPGTCAQ